MNGLPVTIAIMADLRWLLFGLQIVCSAVFAFIVVSISAADPAMFHEPLSNFRYGRWAAFGLFAFFLLVVVGLIYVAIAIGNRDRSVTFVAILSTILIMFVSATPTVHAGHELAANGLMIMLFGYYGVRLYAAASLWLMAHLAAPIIVLGLILSFSQLNFGTIQKSFIFYLVLMVVIDSAMLLNLAIPLANRKKRSSHCRRRENRWDRLLDDA